MALSVGRIFGLIELRDQFTSQLRNAAAEVDRAVPKVQTLQKRFEDLGGNLRNAGFALTAGITAPIAGVGALAIKSSIDFQTAMNRLEATSTGTAEEVAANMVKMRSAAIEWGAKTQFSSTQAADALTELQKGGLSANQAIAALPSTLQLATAGQMSLAEAATLSANTMATFGLRAQDMATANDALAKAANLSTIDVRDLAESFKYVGPVARQSGVSLEFTAAAMAAMGESGIKGSMGGTALRGVLTTLMTPTDKQAALMEKLGMSTAFADGKMKSLPDILAMVEAQIKRTGNAGQVGADVMELFGDRAGPGMLALVNKGSAGLSELEKKLHDVGYAGRVSDAMMKGLPGAIERMTGAVETAATSLGDVLAPAAEVVAAGIEKLANFITNYLVPAFNAVPGPVKVYIGLLTALAAAIGPLLLVLGGLSSAFAALLPVLTSTGILLTSTGAAATTAATGTTAMATATVSLNTALLTTVARFTVIGGLIAGIIAALPKAIEGIKNLGDIGGESWKQDTSSPLYWRNWAPKFMGGRDAADPNAPDFGPRQNKNLAAPTFNIAALGVDMKLGAGGLAEALKKVDDELKKFKEHPDKVRDLTAAIKTGAFTTDQLAMSAGISEMAVKKFATGIKETKSAANDAEKDLRELESAAQQLADRGMAKIIQYAKTGKNEIELFSGANIQSIEKFSQLRDAMVASTKTGLNEYLKESRTSLEGLRDELIITVPTTGLARDGQISFAESLVRSAAAGEAFAGKAVVTHGMIDKLTGSTSNWRAELSNLADAMTNLSQTAASAVVSAFASVVNAFDVGTKAIDSFKGGFDKLTSGKGLGSILGGLSGIVGGIGGIVSAAQVAINIGKALFSLFDRDKGRDMVEQFAATFGGFDPLHKKLLMMGDAGEQLWIRLTQKVGKNDTKQAQEAIAAIEEAFAKMGITAKSTIEGVIDDLNSVPRDIDITFRRKDTSLEETAAEGYARGGRVLAFRHRGADTIPAMLTPGEIVLNAAQQDNVAASLTMNDPAATADVSSRPVHIHMYQDGRKTGEAIVPHLADIINLNVA